MTSENNYNDYDEIIIHLIMENKKKYIESVEENKRLKEEISKYQDIISSLEREIQILTTKTSNQKDTVNYSITNLIDEKGFVANEIFQIKEKKDECPLCSSILKSQVCSIPVYKSKKERYGYYKSELWYCEKCGKFFIKNSKLVEINNIINPHIIKLSSIQPKPISGKSKSYNLSNDHELLLNDRSFLMQLGYSTSVPEQQRLNVLKNQAIPRFGKQKVIQMLEFFIKSRRAQERGAETYRRAISIWESDLTRVRNNIWK